MYRPFKSFLFGLVVFGVLALACYLFPEEGLYLTNGIQLKFPDLKTVAGIKVQKADISSVLAKVDAIDTNFSIVESPERLKTDSLVEKKDSSGAVEIPKEIPSVENEDTVPQLITSIQMRNKNALTKFFLALSDAKTSKGSIRVLHYGDSQIEGDRITDYLRLKLQGQFGGSGPGLVSLMPVASSSINRIENGPGWDRYNVFTAKDKRVAHNNYGVLAGFNRFTKYRKATDTSSVMSSSLTITTTKFGGTNAMAYKKVKIFYGGAKYRTWCEFYDGPALIGADSLDIGGIFRMKEYKVGRGSNSHTFKFRGKDSPDFYALSLESDNGVMVDNIALRGSSGTFFHNINNAQLSQFYEYLNVKLIILQFGGNSLPAIEDPSMAINYSNYIRYQISLLKKMAPDASILFIGPSDMSIKQGTEYVTYPYLETMRDALKKAVLESDCAFFDMYDAMGGRNSMASWVEQKLAATDYTHFSPQGARKIATLFYSELIKEYNKYLKSKQ
ncbi:MAG: hypothetical protein JNL60_02055 [Bacteroidia bacterium]|nr:hypothetical protein [Bacteroidia bacterium]